MKHNHPLPEAETTDSLGDLLFIIRYASKASLSILKYTTAGAVLGLSTGFLMLDDIKQFAENNMAAVDLTGTHVPDCERFLHMSRHSAFNQVSRPISAMLPTYSMLLGGSVGFFFGVSRNLSSFGNTDHPVGNPNNSSNLV